MSGLVIDIVCVSFYEFLFFKFETYIVAGTDMLFVFQFFIFCFLRGFHSLGTTCVFATFYLHMLKTIIFGLQKFRSLGAWVTG